LSQQDLIKLFGDQDSPPLSTLPMLANHFSFQEPKKFFLSSILAYFLLR
jgi:hypothetical protein